MAILVKDRVKETTTTTGTGAVTLLGAAAGFQSFSVIGNSNVTYYAIVGQSVAEWEIGVGTYTSSGTTLSRDTILASSNSGSAVNFSAGTKDVFVTYPASAGQLPYTLNNQTSTYTVVVSDLGKVINCTTGTFTVNLTSAATLGSGFNCWVWNSGAGTITIDPASSETIDGASTVSLSANQTTQIISNGTNWYTVGRSMIYGDVNGPSSATDGQIVLFNGTTGKLIKAGTTTGLLKATSGVVTAATAGTDYAAATTGTNTQLLANNGSGGFSNVTVGSGLNYSTGTLTATGGNAFAWFLS